MMFALPRGTDTPWQLLALLPVMALATYWMWGELALVGLAAALPPAVLAYGLFLRRTAPLSVSDQVTQRLDRTLSETGAQGGATG